MQLKDSSMFLNNSFRQQCLTSYVFHKDVSIKNSHNQLLYILTRLVQHYRQSMHVVDVDIDEFLYIFYFL